MTSTITDIIERCFKCGRCIEQCPILSRHLNGGDTAPLMADIIDILSDGPCTRKARELIWTCMGCYQCRQWCPERIAPDIFTLARRELLRRGSAPIEKLQQWLPDSPYHFGRLISTLILNEKPPWLSKPAPMSVTKDIVVYLGCYVLATPEIAITLLRLIEQMGMSAVALGGDGLCCGAGYLLNGKYELAHKARQYSAELIKSYRPRTVVFECASCHAFISPLVTGLESLHHVDFLFRNLSRIKLSGRGRTITYHDSCDPRRGIAGDYETPRRLLSSLPGIKLVEMKHNRQNSICCGGLANTTNHPATEKLRTERLKEAAATGAEMMATTCRSCYGAMVGFDKGLPKVTHDVLLVGESAGIVIPEHFRELTHCNDISGLLAGGRVRFLAAGLNADIVSARITAFLQRHRPTLS